MPSQVTFKENEVSAVHIVDRLLDYQAADELFYQAADYCRFRSDYRLFKENQVRLQHMRRFNEMPQEEQYKIQIQLQVKFIMNFSSLAPCTSPQAARLPPGPTRSVFPTQRPKISHGIAAMA